MTLPSLDLQDPALAQALAGRSLVLSASAGSGKTFALVTLVLGHLGSGGRAPGVLATTFGREAAADLRARILEPLDQLASWREETWREGLQALAQGFPAWDAWIGGQGARREIAMAARQWGASGEASWRTSAAEARTHWIRTRREAELLRATTVHALAQSLLRQRGLAASTLLEADDPVLVRLLRAAGRDTLSLPDTHDDHGAARRLWAWCEGREATSDRWSQLALAFDGHLDALGDWRNDTDTKAFREAFLGGGRTVLEAYSAFVREPFRAAATTKQGKPHSSFQRYGLARIQPECAADAAPGPVMDALERLAARFLKKDDGTLPNYFSEGFAEALEPLVASLPAALEAWMTLLLERVFQAFRRQKSVRELRSYGDLVRDAWESLKGDPLPQPPALLLVDEYQDINPLQEAFLEALQAARTVRVGDPKQAIYGFRGGVSALLKDQLHKAQAVGEAFRLPANHRSSAPVVETANAFVAAIMPSLEPGSSDPDGVQLHSGRGEGQALVALAGVPSGKRGADLAAASPWIAALSRPEGWAAAGLAPGTSRRRALLLPRRTGLAELRRNLQAEHVEPLVQSREGFWESPGVRLVMALLEAVAHPEATLARMAVLRSPWWGATDPELRALAAGAEAGDRVAQGLAWLEGLRSCSTQALVAEAVRRPGLLALLGALEVHGALEPARARRNLERFLGWVPGLPAVPALAWATLRRMRAFRDPGDAPAPDAAADLVVQTIHGSKGLEYDDVVLPLLANPVKGLRKGTLRQRPSEPGALWMGWKLGNAKGPALQEFQEDETHRVFREGLNLLYVGLTRARDRMVLLQQWPDGAPPPSGQERLAQDKKVQWHHVGSDLRAVLPELPVLETAPSVAAGVRVAGPRLLAPEEPTEGLWPEAETTLDQARADRGIRLHALLRDLLARDAVDVQAGDALLLNHPVTQAWPEAAGLATRLRQELRDRGWSRLPRRMEFELPGAGALGSTGRADLVLWEPDRYAPRCIHVVDFKLVQERGPHVRELRRLQLQAYVDALSRMHEGVPVEGWIAGLEDGTWERLV